MASGAPWKLRSAGSSADAAIRADGGDAEGWSMRAASVAGVRHRLAGVGNDDAFAWRAGASALVVAVADGVGTVPGSAAAAQVAVEVAVTTTVDALHSEDALRAGLEAANVALLGGQGATTLVVAVVGPDGQVVAGRVGDSGAFLLLDRGWSEVFTPEPPDDGAVVDSATLALPSSSPAIETTTLRLVPGSALVLVTDGLANPLRDGPETVAPALADVLAEPPSALDLAGIIDFSRQGCHDDRTLLGVWAPRPEFGS